MEAPVVLRAFDDVCPSPGRRRDACCHGCRCRRSRRAGLIVAIEGEGFLAVVEANHVGADRDRRRRRPRPIPLHRAGRRRNGRLPQCRGPWARAADASRNRPGSFTWRRTAGTISRHARTGCSDTARAVVLHDRMQLRQRVIRHQREHVVLDVVVHVPVEKPVDRIHVHRAAVEPMIEHVLRQPGMLGDDRKRTISQVAEEVGQARSEHQRQHAAQVNRERESRRGKWQRKCGRAG